nr:hypothetical protein [Candidatus Gracilibacteria bacterium]
MFKIPYWSTAVGKGFSDFILDIIDGEIYLENLNSRETFNYIYNLNVNAGDWKKRTEEEIEEISKGYLVFKVKGIIIGGCYIKIGNRNFTYSSIIECFWISEKGCGYGTKALNKIKSIVHSRPIYTYSKKGGFFEKNGFKKEEGIISTTGAQRYKFL